MMNFNVGAPRRAKDDARQSRIDAANDLVQRTLAQHGLTMPTDARPMTDLPGGMNFRMPAMADLPGGMSLPTGRGHVVLVSFVQPPLGQLLLSVSADTAQLGFLVVRAREAAVGIQEWLTQEQAKGDTPA